MQKAVTPEGFTGSLQILSNEALRKAFAKERRKERADLIKKKRKITQIQIYRKFT